MVSVNNITLSFGSFNLLDGITFSIGEKERIGLVGKNGAGKSTLMKLICGDIAPTSGSVDKPDALEIGFLPQVMEHHKGRSVFDETMTAFRKIILMREELESATASLSERTDYESQSYLKLIDRVNELNDALSVVQDVPPEVAARKTLLGLGFKEDELDRKTETFSQGWNMRIELAKILLQKPDLLLLDEPTNHLDIESIEWFEDYLKSYRGAVMLVSHDRRFLDNVTGRTIEIMLGHLHDYRVPYSQYVELRSERLAQQQASYENQQRMI